MIPAFAGIPKKITKSKSKGGIILKKSGTYSSSRRETEEERVAKLVVKYANMSAGDLATELVSPTFWRRDLAKAVYEARFKGLDIDNELREVAEENKRLSYENEEYHRQLEEYHRQLEDIPKWIRWFFYKEWGRRG